MLCRLPRPTSVWALGLWLVVAPHRAFGQDSLALPPAPTAPSAPSAPTLQNAFPTAAQDPGGLDGLDDGPNELAYGPTDEAIQHDPPGRTGRVRVLAGKASVRASGETTWIDAQSNRPWVTGDALWVGRKSRVAVQLGETTVFVGPETAVTVVALNDQLLRLSLTQGRLLVHTAEDPLNAAVHIDLPELSASWQQPGDYHLACGRGQGPSAPGALTVRHGLAQVRLAQAQVTVSEGQRLVALKRDPAGYALGPAPAPDRLEEQSAAAVARADRLEALRYMPRSVVGYDDLDAHGSWSQAPEYGPVWTPRHVAREWAPFRFGHWAVIAPWGHTWVDDAPWGFAPFHYGRWVFVGSSWAWAPGPAGQRPLYAPHLVSFGRPQNGRDVAWVPLGYGDPFVPAYGASALYLQAMNLGAAQVFVGVGAGCGFANCAVPGAITVVPFGVLGGGLGVGTSFGVGSAHRFGPGAFGAPMPMPRGEQPWPRGYPQGARPGSALPPRWAQPPSGGGPAGAPSLRDIRYGAAPGGRAGGPYVPRASGAGRPEGRPAFGPPPGPPVGRFEPMSQPMAHPVQQPGVGHPGFLGHMGAPSYHGGGGYGGGRPQQPSGGPNRPQNNSATLRRIGR